MKYDLIFCSHISPGHETDALLFAESLRHFGGAFADKPIWMMLPDFGKALHPYALRRLAELNVRVIPFEVEKEKLRFFFVGELTGLARAESLAAAETDCLVWMDANTMVVNEPNALALPQGAVLAYRPVQHLLVGSRFDAPLDEFWTAIYRACAVPEERVFPMRLTVQDLDVRPYFNAGFLVLDPRAALVRLWYDKFMTLYQSAEFQPFYSRDGRYEIFMHQAVLAGVVLSNLERSQLHELPRGYNYPLDLHNVDETAWRPRGMEETVTFRFEGFYRKPDWQKSFPANAELTDWVVQKVDEIRAGLAGTQSQP